MPNFKIPLTMEGALRSGWAVEFEEGRAAANEHVIRGSVFLTNPTLPGLVLEVPYTSARSYGKPDLSGHLMSAEEYQEYEHRLRAAVA